MSDESNAVKGNYEKLGGWLLVFVICLCVFFAVNTIVVFGNALFFIMGMPSFYTIIAYAFHVCITIIYINAVVKKPPNALFNIRNLLRLFLIFSIAPFIPLIFLAPLKEESEVFSAFLFNPFTIALIILNFLWHLGWFFYFKRSKRAAVYFGILDPETGSSLQEKEKNMEQEIIDEFIKHNAVSKENAVDPKELSIDIINMTSKHALTAYNMRYVSRQIWEVKGKFYYDASSKGKYFGNVPVKFFKVIGIILLVCIVLFIVALIMMNIES